MALTDKLTTIANAIRSKTGKSDALTLDQMATEIESISAGGGSTEEWIGDGNTHIWITLGEGRTSPMLGCCPNGTVTVDWGDGTTPDTLTGTSTSTVKWTPNHNYAAPGDYMITLTVDGEMGLSGVSNARQRAYILRYASSDDGLNHVYRFAVRKVEVGESTLLKNYMCGGCCYLQSINISEGVTSIGEGAAADCYALSSINIPAGVTNIGVDAFSNCHALSSINIPAGVTNIGARAFYNCYALSSINIPAGVTNIGASTFYYCYSVRFYDFTKHTAVPTLEETNAFRGIPTDCEIRVPAALYDEWIAATNWSTYAANIVAV